MVTETLLLNRSHVAALLTLEECIGAVENAFRMYGEGKASPPAVLGVHARNGGFQIKTGILDLNKSYLVAKTNATFPLNPKHNGLPTIQGVVAVSNAENGRLLGRTSELDVIVFDSTGPCKT